MKKAIPSIFICILMAMGGHTATAETEPVVYRLKWLLNASVVGDLYAERKGLFHNAGLQVTIKSGGPERDAIKELELGYAHFGVASADQVIRALSKGAPVVVIAQIFQKNPLQWIYRAGPAPITRLRDLKGKTIGITYGGNDETIMRTLLAFARLGEQDVRFFSVRYDYTPFFNHRVSLWPVYRNSQAIILEEKLKQGGETARFLDPAHFGVTVVANSLVTAEAFLESRPEIVQRFTRAVLSGWTEALKPENENAAVQCVQAFDRDTPPPLLRKQIQATARLVRPDPARPVGAIDVPAWRQTEQILRQQGQLPGPVAVAAALRPVGVPLRGL